MNSHQLKEENIFTQYYSKLCDTLMDVSNLLPYFVTKEIIKSEDAEEINTLSTSTQKCRNY